MKSLLLVHGAGSGPWVFEGWAETFAGVEIDALDLHAGLQVTEASMLNYEAAVACAAALLPRPLAVCGWSMGGLAAMMAAHRVEAEVLILLEPSPPGEVQGFDATIPVEAGTFDPEAVYGAVPAGVRARPESSLARAERKRGISVPVLPGRVLVVSGAQFSEERGSALAELYGADLLAFPEARHWDLVLDSAVREAVAARLSGSR
jgi:pimeloyl-ACP methyl ester carboxylesterase